MKNNGTCDFCFKTNFIFNAYLWYRTYEAIFVGYFNHLPKTALEVPDKMNELTVMPAYLGRRNGWRCRLKQN